MKIIIIIAFIFLLIFNLPSYAQWTQTGSLEGGNVSSIAVNGTNIYAIAPVYGFYLSTNSGASWIKTSSTFPADTSVIASIGSKIIAGNRTGVHISINTGASWTLSNSGLPSNPRIFCFAINGNNILAGTTNGVYSSADTGSTWTNPGIVSSNILSIAISGINLFATDSFAIYRSQDNGATWNIIFTHTATNFISLAANGADIYAGSYQGSVFYSTNNGVSWTNFSSNTGTGPKKVFVSGSNIFVGTTMNLYASTNNGSSWFTTNSFKYNVTSVVSDGTYLYAGTDNSGSLKGAGIFVSPDNGITWVKSINGMSNASINTLSINGFDIYSGTCDGLFFSSDAGTNWNKIENKNIGSIASNGSHLYCAGNNDPSYSSSYGIVLSTNNGTTWDSVYYGYPVAVSGSNVFAGTGYSSGPVGGPVINTSTDNGSTWFTSYSDMENEARCFAVNGSKAYAETDYGLFISTDAGQSWNVINSSMNTLNCIITGGTSDLIGSINGGTSPGIYRSTDDGLIWFSINNGLPAGEIISSISNLVSYVYIGTDKGVYEASLFGVSWMTVGTGLPPYTRINSLVVSNGCLYAGTDGNGVWSITLPMNINSNQEMDEISTIYPNPANEYIKLKYNLREKEIVSIKIINISGKEISIMENAKMVQGRHEIKINTDFLENGLYLCQLKTGSKIENLNFVVIK